MSCEFFDDVIILKTAIEVKYFYEYIKFPMYNEIGL